VRVYRSGRRTAAFSELDIYKDARATFKSKVAGRGPLQMKMKGDDTYSRALTLPTALKRLDALIPLREDQSVWFRDPKDVIFVFDAGELHVKIPTAPANVSPSIVKAHRLTFAAVEELKLSLNRDLRVTTMGYTVCKWISGTRDPSEHCPGPPTPVGGNAMDWAVFRKNSDGRWVVDIEATDRVVARLKASGFPEVLWRGVANHYPNHAHTSGNPKRVGLPACLR